jgi:hypothetical protein
MKVMAGSKILFRQGYFGNQALYGILDTSTHINIRSSLHIIASASEA